MTTTTSTTDRPGLEELCTVFFDRQFSTPWTELYRAASDTVAGRVYEVRFYPESRAWTCNCPATVPCKHIRKADRLRRIRSFSALYAGQPPRVLRAELARREERIASGTADADDYACADMIALRLDNIEAA